MLVSLVMGCGMGVTLSEVEVVGGSAESRAAVRQELAAFDRATGVGRLRIREVRFTDALAERGIGGMVRGNPSLVLIDERNTVPVLHRLVRHELCHALDFAEELVRDGPPVLDRLADDLLASRRALDVPTGDAASEVMASLCERGPVLAQSLTSGACGDPPEAVAVSAWLLDEVWIGDLPEVLERDDVPIASWVADYVIDGQLALSATTQPDRLELSVTASALEGEADVRWVDLYTGEETPRASRVEACCTPFDPYWYGFVAEHWVGTADAGAAVGTIALNDLGKSGERLLVFDGEWHAVAGCARAEEDVLMVEGEPWSGWIDEDTVRWGPLP